MKIGKSYSSRWEYIEGLVKNKDVLDIGPAELTGTLNVHKLNNGLHSLIRSVSKTLIGLEKSQEQVNALTAKGFNILQGDAEKFCLNQKFETIFAGELIEHLSNPGLFLDNVRKHMTDDGILVLTTPNRFDAATFVSYFRRNLIPSYNKPIAKHVTYFDENCLTDLLERHGFTVIEVAYYKWVGDPKTKWTTRLFLKYLEKYRRQYLPGIMIAAKKN